MFDLRAPVFPGIPPEPDDWREWNQPGPEWAATQTAFARAPGQPGQFGDPNATQADIEARRRAAQFGNFMGLNPVVRQAIAGLAGTLSPEASLRAIDEATAAQNSQRASNTPGQAQDPRFMSAEAIIAAVPTLRRQLGGGGITTPPPEQRGPDFTPQGRSPIVGGPDPNRDAGLVRNAVSSRGASPRWQAGKSDVVDNPGGPALAISPDGTVYPTAGNYGAYQRLQAATGAREGANGRLNFEDLLGTVRRNEAAGLPTPTGTGIGMLDSMAGGQAVREARQREDELRRDERTYAEQQRRVKRQEAANDLKAQQDREDALIAKGINPRGSSTTAKPNYAGENYDAKFQREQQVLAQQAEAAGRLAAAGATLDPMDKSKKVANVQIGENTFYVPFPADMPPDQAEAFVVEQAMALAGVVPQQEAPAPAPSAAPQFSARAKSDMDAWRGQGFTAADYIAALKKKGGGLSPDVEAAINAYWRT